MQRGKENNVRFVARNAQISAVSAVACSSQENAKISDVFVLATLFLFLSLPCRCHKCGSFRSFAFDRRHLCRSVYRDASCTIIARPVHPIRLSYANASDADR